jgi:hypothetical protein
VLKGNTFIGGLLGLFLLTLYLFTSSRTVTPEDSGMLILSALTLGISHPSGYPLYVLLGHLFSYLPFESVAFRIHFFSSLCAVGACLSLYWVLLQLQFKRSYSSAGALLFGLSQTLWYHAIVAEVYALNAFFFFFLLGLALRIQSLKEKRRARLWVLWAFVFGLSLANHWPLMMLASPVYIILFYREWLPRINLTLSMTAALFAGLTPYLYLLLRSDPEFAFTGPIENTGEWIDYIRRSYYSDIEVEGSSGLRDASLFVVDFFKQLRFEVGIVGALLAFGGMFSGRKYFSRQKFGALLFGFLSSSVLLHFVFFAEYNAFRSEALLVYHLVPYGLTCLFFVLGLTRLQELLSRHGKLKVHSHGIVFALSLLSVGVLGLQNYSRVRFTEHSLVNDYAKLVLSHVPKDASLFVYGDTDVGPFAYTQYAEKVRPDIEIYSQSGEFYKNRLFHPLKANASTQKWKIEEYIKKKGVVYSTKTIAQLSSPESKEIKRKNHGLFYSYSKAGYLNGPEFQLPPTALPQALEILDRSQNGNYSSLWQYHRDAVIFRLCSFAYHMGKEHPLSETNRGCKRARASHFLTTGRADEADALLLDLLESSRNMLKEDRIQIYVAYYVNRMNMINRRAGTLEAKTLEYQNLVDKVWPAMEFYPVCENSLVPNLMYLKEQVDVNFSMDHLRSQFGSCPQFKKIF